ncbi:hypothetical protein [Actinoplanes derwentensis]|uniref:hypothetical protein n=1 Tax=Actinoplanes derwentensis TaxID=113562 RepID=UPI0012FD8681|nr:hypothetical protein [Actinoplanes derwentensis]GID90531.1 hypothetical protein Ade03nite_94550 [Actinoplanes derwentensis]
MPVQPWLSDAAERRSALFGAADFNPTRSPSDRRFWEQHRTAHPEQPDFIVTALPIIVEDAP